MRCLTPVKPADYLSAIRKRAISMYLAYKTTNDEKNEMNVSRWHEKRANRSYYGDNRDLQLMSMGLFVTRAVRKKRKMLVREVRISNVIDFPKRQGR